MAETRWLTIIGIGDNGAESLTSEARQALKRAETVVVSGRLTGKLNLQDKHIIHWDQGYRAGLEAIRARAGTPVTILATGDPMHYGIGASLLKEFSHDEMTVLPSPSAFSLAAARLGWALQNVECLSLHGRPLDLVKRHLMPGNRLIALTSDGASPGQIAQILVKAGYGESRMTVLEHMGGIEERRETLIAGEATGRHFADFNTVALDLSHPQHFLAPVPGLPDDAFRHDGQLTKSEVRAVTLAKLKPFPEALLWDVGAGCGSVAIEWMRSVRGARAIAIEERPARLEMIRVNAGELGVPGLTVVAGAAPDALMGLETPDAVFIGGGITDPGVFEASFFALKPGGILVANAVTLEGEAELTRLRAIHGGEIVRIAVSRGAPVGRFCGLKSLMPVTIWSVVKGQS